MRYLIILTVLLFLVTGCSDAEASVEIDEAKVTFDELQDRIQELEKSIEDKEFEESRLVRDIEDAVTEYDRVDEKYSRRKNEYDEARELHAEREEIRENVNASNDILEEKKLEIEELDEEISEKERELASITGELKEVWEEPITLSAGHYIVGSDLPPGRYKAEPSGSGTGNFFVRENGRSKVSIILGKDSDREDEVIFWAELGDEMELKTSLTFTEVE